MSGTPKIMSLDSTNIDKFLRHCKDRYSVTSKVFSRFHLSLTSVSEASPLGVTENLGRSNNP